MVARAELEGSLAPQCYDTSLVQDGQNADLHLVCVLFQKLKNPGGSVMKESCEIYHLKPRSLGCFGFYFLPPLSLQYLCS